MSRIPLLPNVPNTYYWSVQPLSCPYSCYMWSLPYTYLYYM
ncbi:hypothetical protein M3J07_004366 [Ascochyta lentis]